MLEVGKFMTILLICFFLNDVKSTPSSNFFRILIYQGLTSIIRLTKDDQHPEQTVFNIPRK